MVDEQKPMLKDIELEGKLVHQKLQEKVSI